MRHRNAVALGGSVGRALLEAGAVVQDILVLFDYGTFPTQAARSRWQPGIHGLATWRGILDATRDSGEVAEADLAELQAFLADPPRWSSQHGGIAAWPSTTNRLPASRPACTGGGPPICAYFYDRVTGRPHAETIGAGMRHRF